MANWSRNINHSYDTRAETLQVKHKKSSLQVIISSGSNIERTADSFKTGNTGLRFVARNYEGKTPTVQAIEFLMLKNVDHLPSFELQTDSRARNKYLPISAMLWDNDVGINFFAAHCQPLKYWSEPPAKVA